MSDLDAMLADEPEENPVADAPEIIPEPEPAPEPEPQPEPEPAPEPAPVNQPAHVPVTALMDERFKRQQFEDRSAALERELQQLRSQQQAQTQPQAAPDPYEDPQGFAQFMEHQQQQMVVGARLDISEEMARQTHGEELTEKAKAWAIAKIQQSPAFQQELLSQRHPYGHAVTLYQREEALEKVKDPARLQAFLAWEASQASAPQNPAIPMASPSSPAAPPRSIANLSSAGGVALQVEKDPFEAEFKKE